MMLVFKFIFTPLAIIAFILTAIPGYILLPGEKKYRYCMALTSFWCKVALKTMNISVEIKEKINIEKNKSLLLISNHMSYIDILIIASFIPSLFVTSIETKKAFFLGLMSSLGGS